tara:strand:+ start:133 stop:315 length:183 start_codon:yes stop_codon:yes gene_type:complete
MALKDVPAGNKGKGLSMLPTPVRNKMGFKKKGGTVKARDGKFMTRKEMAGASQMPKLNRS